MKYNIRCFNRLMLYVFVFFVFVSKSYCFAFPMFKVIMVSKNYVSVGNKTEICADPRVKAKYKVAFLSLTKKLLQYKKGDISRIIIKKIDLDSLTEDNVSDFLKLFPHEGSYILRVKAKEILILAIDDEGCINGITSLEYLIEQKKGKLPLGEIFDYPDLKIRALHVVIKNAHNPSIQELKRIIDMARFSHLNVFILQIANSVELPNATWFSVKDAWSEENFKKVVDYARESGLEVVPEVKLLSHQEKFFRNRFPELMYNRLTYNSADDQVYEKVFTVLTDIINMIHPRVIHIGHDEVAGFSQKSKIKWLKEGESVLPADLFLKDVLKIYLFLRRKNINVWMWGDMFLSKRNPLFKGMFLRHLHAPDDQYEKIIDELPKDIVICDWHYKEGNGGNFPSVDYFLHKGFKVIGASWLGPKTTMDFSGYIYLKRKDGAIGMIATTWFYVTKKNWLKVRRIITFSGESFWNASMYIPSNGVR